MEKKKRNAGPPASKIIVYTDGGSRGNPGLAAAGIVIQNEAGETIAQHAKVLGNATNNEAEYQAVIFALEKIKSLWGKEQAKKTDIEVRMDSEVVGRQMLGEYKIEEERLYPFFIRLWNLRMEFKSVSFLIIRREKNKMADALVNEILDREQKILF